MTKSTGDQTAYPVYMSLGNIDSDVCARPSSHAWVLVGYLPTAKLDNAGLGEQAARLARARLFHHCMSIIVEPLKELGKTGKFMTAGDGAVRHCFPIVACYIADHPEQTLVTCTRYAQMCPICSARAKDFGRNSKLPTRNSEDTLTSIRDGCDQSTATRQNELLKEAGVTGVVEPFWKDLPHCNIHETITPDILHQLYQGVVRHAVEWVQRVVGVSELDARFQRLPPTHGVRLFKNGISTLQQVSGPEHKEISKQLLGCMVGNASRDAVRATRALLDFLYIAQYCRHSTETLQYLQDALNNFHANKDAFDDVLNSDWNFPKVHMLQHFIDSIRLFGTTNNYNTETSERLHIDFVKDAYQATNKKDAIEQMCRWLLRREALFNFDAYVEWRTGEVNPKEAARRRYALKTRANITLAQRPSARNVSLPDLATAYGVPDFTNVLQAFVEKYRDAHLPGPQRARHVVGLDVDRVHVWHVIKFSTADALLGTRKTHEIVHAKPASAKNVARFDTVLVNEKAREERADMVGIDGQYFYLSWLSVAHLDPRPSSCSCSHCVPDPERPRNLCIWCRCQAARTSCRYRVVHTSAAQRTGPRPPDVSSHVFRGGWSKEQETRVCDR